MSKSWPKYDSGQEVSSRSITAAAPKFLCEQTRQGQRSKEDQFRTMILPSVNSNTDLTLRMMTGSSELSSFVVLFYCGGP